MKNSKNLNELDNPDNSLINFHEEFRRSKRNSLIWSSLLFVFALSSSTGEGGEQVTRIFGTSLIVPQAILVLTLMIAALFFVASYARSKRVVELLNSKAAQAGEQSWFDSQAMMRELEVRIRLAGSKANEVIETASDTKTHIKKYRNEVSELRRHLTEVAQSEEYQAAEQQFRQELSKLGDRSQLSSKALSELQSISHTLTSNTAKREAHALQRLGNFNNAANDIDHLLKDRGQSVDARIEEIRSTFNTLRTELGAFRTDLEDHEERWFRWLDVRAVWLLFFVAFLTGILRLTIPSHLERVVQSLG